MNHGSAAVMAGIGIIAVIALAISILAFTSGYAAGETITTSIAKTSNNTRLTVSGQGVVSAAPDKAVISFVSLGYGKTASEALEKCSSKTSSVISALKQLGLTDENLETTGIYVTPRYDWNQKPPKLVDYEASYTLRVEVSDVTLVGKIIDTAMKAGADKLYGLQFTLSAEKKKELTSAAIKAAINDAMGKAKAAAEALGMHVVKVEVVNLSPQYTVPPVVKLAYEGGVSQTPIIPGESKISVSVTISCAIAP
ncbi:MAG: SIMPL domain-containing protein [Thaumarchaeota archaeon]|nr:SIMPL domain-containing protein [Nitrososphaerota archaeon]